MTGTGKLTGSGKRSGRLSGHCGGRRMGWTVTTGLEMNAPRGEPAYFALYTCACMFVFLWQLRDFW